MVKIVGKYANMASSKQILHCWQTFVKEFKNKILWRPIQNKLRSKMLTTIR